MRFLETPTPSAGGKRGSALGHGAFFVLVLSSLTSPLALTGCQGLEWGNDTETPSPTVSPTPINEVTPTPEPGTTPVDQVTLTLGNEPLYFKFEDRSAVTVTTPEDSTTWDLRFSGSALHLNGGQSGPGEAWGLGPVGTGTTDYEALTDHSDVVGPIVYYDEFESVMTDWYSYIVSGQVHGVYSRYHVYGIEVDSSHSYKVQILDYYDLVNGSLESGMITFRWASMDSSTPIEQLIDARAGGAYADEDDPNNKYTYFSFETGVVELTDAEAAASTAWDLAFKRYDVKLNGGVSGPKGVMGVDFQADREESNAEIADYTPESELPEFQQATWSSAPGPLVEDRIGSIMQGNYATDENGKLIPSNDVYVASDASGTSYYKVLLTGLKTNEAGIPTEVTLRVAEIE